MIAACHHLKCKPSCVGNLVHSNATFVATLRCSSLSSMGARCMTAVSSLFSFFLSFFLSIIRPSPPSYTPFIALLSSYFVYYCIFSHPLEVLISGANFISGSANAIRLGLASRLGASLMIEGQLALDGTCLL
ncbi:hypothetical protein HD554DRAFT_1757192 [Boletus coccyginus]|nr:hypothetical protein HD554DRAFT_1757192 [Boletus coccyginus]